MPRVTLEEQNKYEFKFKTTIQTRDLNYANHLGNDALVSLLQESRVALFKKLGFKELDLGDGRTGIIIGDLLINFKAEGFLFDELSIEDHIGDITEKSFRIYSRVVATKNNTVLALAETGVVAFDYKARKITTIPEAFRQALEKLKSK